MGDNWIEVFLNEKDFLVSGTKGFAHRFGLSRPDKERPSIRFVASDPSGSRALFLSYWKAFLQIGLLVW